MGAAVPTDQISPGVYRSFTDFLKNQTGISLSSDRQFLVATRLMKRVAMLEQASLNDYLSLVVSQQNSEETRVALELLTTNETYFWREPQSFDHLRGVMRARMFGPKWRLWSAACSSGEEVYSLAMLANQELGPGNWRLLGTDINRQMLIHARKGEYVPERIRHLPDDLRRSYLTETSSPMGPRFQVKQALRDTLELASVNLIKPLSPMGPFDVVFLRNVLLYFERDRKIAVIDAVLSQLQPNGLLYTSVTESLSDLKPQLKRLAPGVYQRPESVRQGA